MIIIMIIGKLRQCNADYIQSNLSEGLGEVITCDWLSMHSPPAVTIATPP